MPRFLNLALAASLTALPFALATAANAQDASFFITSAGPGDGANLGGLEGADAHCAALADAAGLPAGDWVAYLSAEGVNARDRIGTGPWHNVNGELIAEDIDSLHSTAEPTGNGLGKATSLSESGDVVNGRGDEPNRHDILTGSNLDGTLAEGMTCEDWTSNAEEGVSAMVGHHDLTGGGDNPTSFNSAHPSRGCSQTALQGTGGDGLFYCARVN